MSVHAVLLAGGRGTRLGGTDKAALVVAGASLLERALAAVASCDRVVVVGPTRTLAAPSRELSWTREHPEHGGPVAALAAGVAALGGADGSSVVVLAADMPWVNDVDLAVLIDRLAVDDSVDAVFAADSEGVTQYLYGVWRLDPLRRSLGDGGDASGRSMHALLPEHFATVPIATTADIDTGSDLEHALGTVTVSLDDARSRVQTVVRPLSSRTVSVPDALDAVLAEPLRAQSAFPRFDTSAMDGYAVAGEGPWTVRPDVVYAGLASTDPLVAGSAVRIATGARVPLGATSVVRDEHVRVVDTVLELRPDTSHRDDTRPVGEDWSRGTILARPGDAVTPALVSTALSAGLDSMVVRGPATVRTVITGNEVRSTGPLADRQIRDSIGPVLPSFLRSCGFRPDGELRALDSETGFDETLLASAGADVVVVVGATGGGAADRLRGALDRAGARIVVGSIACRPGGSTVIALLPDGRVVLGLPGNPYAAVATLLCLGPSIARALCGTTAPILRTGRLVDAPTISSTTRLLPVTYVGDNDWQTGESTRTAHLAGLLGCDGIAVVSPGTVSGDPVEILPIPTR